MAKTTKNTDTTEIKVDIKPETKRREHHSNPEIKVKITFVGWVIELLKDERGATSIKPVIALIGGLILCGALVLTFFMKNAHVPSDTLINAVVFITIAAMGGDTVDKFSFKKTTVNTTSTGPTADEPPLE